MFDPLEYIKRMIGERERLKKMVEPPEYVQRMLEEREKVRQMFEPPEYIKRMIEEQERLRKMVEPPEYVQRMLDEQKIFQEMFEAQSPVIKMLQSLASPSLVNFRAITESISSFADRISIQEFDINSDGSISVDEQSITISELSDAVHNFFDGITENYSLESVFNSLEKLAKPVQRIALWVLNRIIITFFVGILAGFSVPYLQDYFDSPPLRSRREVIQTIKNLPQEIDLSEYKGYRVVTAEVLNLREKPNMKSFTIRKLKRGKLVRVIQKRKNWSKVEAEHSDSHNTDIGWVATRYIEPLHR